MSASGAGSLMPLAGLSVGARLIAHVDVLTALARREVQSRFGENALGYAWTYVAPLAWVAATWFAFYLFARTAPVFTDTVTFIISGLIPYAAFRYVITATGRSVMTVRGMLIFPGVTEGHAITTAALIEYVNIFVVCALVMLMNYAAFGNGELHDPLTFVWGVTLAWGLGGAYAYFFAVLARFNATFTPLGTVLLRPAFFVSGIFFTANELPGPLLEVLGWNPLLHAVDIARDGMLFHYQARVTSAAYVLFWIAGLAVAARALELMRTR